MGSAYKDSERYGGIVEGWASSGDRADGGGAWG